MTKVALITGGQQGIGLGIAENLVAQGFMVALASQLPDHDPTVQTALHALGDNARYFTHDLLDINNIPALLDEIEGQLGPVTTLVNNAGVPARARGDMLDISPGNFDFVLDVNLRGSFFLTQEVASRMLAEASESYRSIVFVTSVSAKMVSVERAEYCISKAAASMMAKTFATRLAPTGIGVFELQPGIIRTAMTEGVKEAYTARIDDGLVPAARWGYPTDIAEIVVAIANGQMGFATGATIPVDGGLSIARL